VSDNGQFSFIADGAVAGIDLEDETETRAVIRHRPAVYLFSDAAVVPTRRWRRRQSGVPIRSNRASQRAQFRNTEHLQLDRRTAAIDNGAFLAIPFSLCVATANAAAQRGSAQGPLVKTAGYGKIKATPVIRRWPVNPPISPCLW